MESEQERREDGEYALAFAREHLGPNSASLVSRPEIASVIQRHIDRGDSTEDAVLKELHIRCAEQSQIADEFLQYFLCDLLRMRVTDLYPVLRRFLDTGDIVQSVLGDIWPELADLEFRNRASFLSLLSQRLKWKAEDKRRGLLAARRQENRRVESNPELLPLGSSSDLGLEKLQRAEEQDRLLRAILRLSPRDRKLVRLHLQGAGHKELGEALDLSSEAARKALGRAIKRVTNIVQKGDIREGTG